MKKEQLSDALNMLDDKIIEETAEIRSHKRRWKKSWGTWAAAAACLALLTYAGIRVLPQPSQDTPSDLLENPAAPTDIPMQTPAPHTPAPGNLPEIPGGSTDVPDPPTYATESPDPPQTAEKPMQKLPLLSISEDNGTGMGYEGYLAYDVSELVNGNPWNETMELSSLPVYQNSLTYDSYFIAFGVDFDAMKEFLLEIAGRLGLDTSSLVITDNAAEKEREARIISRELKQDLPEEYYNPTKYIVEADGMTIEVDQTLTARINFDPPLALPDGYNYTYFAPYADYTEVAEYLKEEYSHLIDMDSPQTNIYGGDYNIYLDQGYDITFYDGAGDDISRIVNYNFNLIAFYCEPEEGRLRFVRIYHPDLSLKLGDYPIITADEARELLLAGHYLTSVPYEMPGREYIKKVELIYHTSELDQYFIPFYRFYVEIDDSPLPNELDNSGIKTYGAYYVPAVEGRYLTNMPVWDGQIN